MCSRGTPVAGAGEKDAAAEGALGKWAGKSGKGVVSVQQGYPGSRGWREGCSGSRCPDKTTTKVKE